MSDNKAPRVLVIDDEQPIRQSVRFFLEDTDYEVLEAENGRIGLERFRAEQPDIVLVDLRMPEVDGLEVLTTVTQESPDTPIIAMSGTGIIADAVEAIRRGAWDYLFKPFEDLTVLHHSIKKALERNRLIKENRAYQENLEMQVRQRTEMLEFTSRELRNREEQYRLLVENQLDMIVKLDTNGRLLFVSPSYCRTFGKTQKELLGKPFMPLIHDEDKEKVARQFEKVFQPPYFSSVDERAYTAEGWRWQEWQNTAIRDKRGNVTAIVAVGRDITARKETEAERERLEMAVEQASETIVITDTEGKITYANPAFEKVSGYSRNEVLGKKTSIFKSGKQDTKFYKKLWDTITSGKTWNGHIINRKKDGTLYTEDATITPIHSAVGQIVSYVAVKRDITQELKLETQLQMAQKMEAIASLTGGIAHDFNNLLTVINGHAEIAKIKASRGVSAQKDIQSILHAGERAEHLTRQLLTFSRKQAYQPKVLDMNQVLQESEQMLRRLISEDIHMEILLGNDAPSVKADPGQVDQVLMNLVVNARDAVTDPHNTREIKKITIQTARIYLDESFVGTHPGSSIGLHVLLQINDNGIGMSQEILEKMFEPFYTTKSKGKGTGLGMSTVYGIVKQNNGSIFVYSEPGQGTTFSIYWPSTEEAKVDETGEFDSHENLLGTETILLVEDDEPVRNFAADMLDSLGYHVYEASNGKHALEVIQKENIVPDLLLTDMVMPVMGGKELAKRLSKEFPYLVIIVASGYPGQNILDTEKSEEGYYFIQKPYSYQFLAHKVRELLDRKDTPPLVDSHQQD